MQVSTTSNEIVLAAGLRTPWVRAGGVFKKEDAGNLGARLSRELLSRTAIEPGQISEVIAGCVGQPHDQANLARVIALRAGLPWEVPARTVARNCASGIESVTTAISSILAGEGDVYLCLGVEVMSAYPLLFSESMTQMFVGLMQAKGVGKTLGVLSKFRPSFLKPRIALMEGLTDPTTGLIMGKTAEVLARDFGIRREEADEFACQSHHRARDARERGRFDAEILPHLPIGAKTEQGSVSADDAIRDDQSVAALGKLRPYFEKPDGTVTVGNSCGITDGACALLVTTRQRAQELGLRPMAKIVSYAWAGLDPARMGLGPVFASNQALQDAGLNLGDMGAIEVNEAFAAQVLACARAFESKSFGDKHLNRSSAVGELPMEKTNVNGGAIALGHPVGATGARLLLTTAHELQAGDHQFGLATLCIGGGQGGAVVLEKM